MTIFLTADRAGGEYTAPPPTMPHSLGASAASPHFRRAELADVPRIVALVERAYRGEPSRAGWTTEADLLGGRRTSEVEVRELVLGHATRMVLAEDRATGALLGTMLVEDEGEHVYVGMLSVEPTQQAAGLGKALLAEAERIAQAELGRARMRMTVIEQRPELLSYYARRGYAPTGATEPFPYGDESFGAPKRGDLRFVVLEKRLG